MSENKEQPGISLEELLVRLKKLEREIFHLKTANCTHGFAPGQHTQGIVGCERCVGKRVMIWDLESDDPHSHSLTP